MKENKYTGCKILKVDDFIVVLIARLVVPWQLRDFRELVTAGLRNVSPFFVIVPMD